MTTRHTKTLHPLNQSGFDHVLAIVVFVVLFALAGSFLLVQSHAASWSGELQLGLDKSICMDNSHSRTTSGNTIDIYSCNATSAQKWTIDVISGNTFTLKDGQGTCADDWQGKVGKAGSPVYLKTYACKTTDHAQVWSWEDSELENAYSHGCINDSGSSKTNSKPLIIYSCSGRPSNELWYEAAQSTSTGGGSSSGGGSSTTAPAIPTAVPSGFTRAFTEDFNTAAPLGSFASVYGSEFGEYDGDVSTNKVTKYDSNIVLYVQNGSLYYNLHSVSGQSYAAAPQAWNDKAFLYGQVGMSVRLDSSTGPGYKIAFLLWPGTNAWSNEVDFPEVDPDFTDPVRAASLNYSPNGDGENGFSSEDNLNTGVYLTDNKYHTFLLTWEPGKMTAAIDGKVVATFTGTAVPAQAMRLSLQAEGWINSGAVPTSTVDVVEVPWVYINTYN